MTEPADHPLLEKPAAGKKPVKRRAPSAKVEAAAKPRARKAAATGVVAPKKGAVKAEASVENGSAENDGAEIAPATQRARKSPVRKASVASAAAGRDPEVAVAEVEVAESAPTRAAVPKRALGRKPRATVPPPPGLSGPVEEWSPSRKPAEQSTPQPVSPASEAAPTENGVVAPTAAAPVTAAPTPAPDPSPARKYPVYIPRHVAKQMEEQGQTAPIAVPADAVPEAARAAVEAAEAARAERAAQQSHRAEGRAEQRTEHSERAERHDRGDRHDRGGRGDRFDRGSRGDRRDAGDRQPRAESAEPGDREEMYRPQGEPPPDEELGSAEGIVEISGKGFGFIRDAKRGFAQHPSDVFVTPETVRRFNLRDGQWIKGETRRGGRGAQLHRLTGINGDDPEASRILPAFDELTVISPMERIVMETTPERNTTRLIDLFTPIGKGQRGLIVAPPRTGKTTLLQHIADAIVKKHPEIVLIILLVDERPEEVTDIKRTVPGAEVMASSNDSDVKSHTRIAQLAVERAKRLVESGKDVFILLDSITRVGRAFNNAMAGGGRTMSGGVDARALEIPRRLFAAARNTEEAGSLTIIATALIETGSRMDELIFQEFKGTGNMELVLDRKIADQRIYPAIDMFQSGTRREELLIPADDLHKINILRRGLAGHKPMEAVERLLFFLRKFPTNTQMLKEIPG